jgi:HK97 gp10 family phage protein
VAKPAIEVEGVRELRRLLRKIESKDIKDALKAANKGAAEVIAAEAKTRTPVRSGRLQKTVKGTGTQASGSIKAGTAARVPYAGVIHFGWGRRNIRPQPFLTDAMSKKLPDARDVYEDLMAEVWKIIESRF